MNTTMKTLTYLTVILFALASCQKSETEDMQLKSSLVPDSLDVYCHITNDTEDSLILTTGYTQVYLFNNKFKKEVHYYAKIACGQEYLISVKSFLKGAPLKLKITFNNDNSARVALTGNYSDYKTYYSTESTTDIQIKGIFDTKAPYFTEQ